jgi:ABC-type Fe3+-siderophore transport system permease subunit
MSEHDEKNQEEQDKRVAFYEAFLTAWIENRMEMDKQTLTLSSAAIGLLMLFYKDMTTPIEFGLWVLAGCSFIVAIILVLLIFRDNSSFIQCLIREDNQTLQNVLEHRLQVMTGWALGSFIFGVVLSFVLAVTRSGFEITKIHGA